MINFIRKFLVRGSKLYSLAAFFYHGLKFLSEVVYYRGLKRIKVYRFGLKERQNYYSQFGQDRLVELLMQKYEINKTFLEIGANHPVNNNNSYYLEVKLGFEGVSVDPIDRTSEFKKLRPNTEFINAFVSDTDDGEEAFISVQNINGWEDQMSSSKSNFKDLGHKFVYKELFVPRISINYLQDQFKSNIGVLFIDVEGHESVILDALSSVNAPRIIISENTGSLWEQHKLHMIMERKGYILIGRVWTSDDVYLRL